MKSKKLFILSAATFILFVAFTIIVKFVDVSAIGPNGSNAGLSSINSAFHNFTGTNFTLYDITDYGGYVAIAIAIVYAIMGLVQWIKRKNIKNVDSDIIILGIFYIIVFAVYVAFQIIKINYRTVLIQGVLETSYPSSTTVLSITFLASSIHMTNKHIKNNTLKKVIKYLTLVFMLFLIIGRVISGVHWLTDIIGGVIVSISLVSLYYALISINKKEK